ncbi:unnamed protein product [Adineta ricciae]|uniref:Uncharacterized protein n=1 Tax=Adineta ricciae TaxID=249248 RepID=A0A813R5N2_ADIRI|nr:unnamed protein product [Adineta ricciae]CAF1205381.1 unnamed protein product [Adineta ricciae]
MLCRTKNFSFIFLTFFVFSTIGDEFFDANDLDWSVRPTDDFFTFVNGISLNRTTIPLSKTEIGSVFTITLNVSQQLKSILDDLTNNGTSEAPHPVDSVQRKLGDLYLAGTDKKTIETVGIKPLEEILLQLDNVKTSEELIDFVTNCFKKMNKDILFDFDVYPDERNTSVFVPLWKQSGLILPERDYYFRNDPFSKNIRLLYRDYIHQLFNLTNHLFKSRTTLIDAEDVLTLETQLAVSHYTPAQLRIPAKNYNKLTIDQLEQMMPNLGWRRILKILQVHNDTVVVAQLDYYQSLDKLLVSQQLNIWKNKIRFSILHYMAPYLSKDFSNARYHMLQYSLYGRQQKAAQWTVIIDDINENCGDLLGQLYVYRHFSVEAKERMLNLTQHIIDVYRNRLSRNKWMNKKTREKALTKLSKMTKKIGYPSTWKTYPNIEINRWSYVESMLSIFGNTFQEKIKYLSRPVDKTEWVIPAQVANCFYFPTVNDIVFPAGILQEPLFMLHADDAINYGSVGSLIGHEITHGFDDQGRNYDENGILNPWWTPEDFREFQKRTQILVEQFNEYKVFGLNVNGHLSLGENIADLGGVEIAYEAFLQTDQAKEGKLIDGFTPIERFFFSFARMSRIKFTDAKLISILKIDPHAPPIDRVNGPLGNMMGFYQTFNVTQNDKMFRAQSKRVHIW